MRQSEDQYRICCYKARDLYLWFSKLFQARSENTLKVPFAVFRTIGKNLLIPVLPVEGA